MISLLFALQYTPHISTKLSPEIREEWESTGRQEVRVLRHQQEMIERFRKAWQLAQENMAEAQQKQKHEYYKRTHVREFNIGDRVLVLLPMTVDILLTYWQGPFDIIKQTGPVDYEIYHPGHQKGC